MNNLIVERTFEPGVLRASGSTYKTYEKSEFTKNIVKCQTRPIFQLNY